LNKKPRENVEIGNPNDSESEPNRLLVSTSEFVEDGNMLASQKLLTISQF